MPVQWIVLERIALNGLRILFVLVALMGFGGFLVTARGIIQISLSTVCFGMAIVVLSAIIDIVMIPGIELILNKILILIWRHD